MKKFLIHILNKVFSARSFALANELGQFDERGYESLFIDPTATLPTPTTSGGANGRWLIYMRGPTGAQYAIIANGTALPLGASEDAPYQVGDLLNIHRLGGVKGIQLAQSAAAITIDHLVYSAPNGLVADLSVAANGTYWVVGRATKTVAAANQDITFIPYEPYQVTVTGGVFAYAIPS